MLRSIEVYPVFFDLVSTIFKKFPFIVNVKLFRLGDGVDFEVRVLASKSYLTLRECQS